MGSNWGLGMFTNDGNCLDCDYGDTVDRISFAARLGGFYIVPMFDMDGKGVLESKRYDAATLTVPSSPASLVPGQKVDPEQADDVAGPLPARSSPSPSPSATRTKSCSASSTRVSRA